MTLTSCPIRFLVSVAFLFSMTLPIASAHNVVSGVYADGMSIEGEVGFSNGDMAEAGSPVKVFNEMGEVIAELSLTDGGVFNYEAKTVAKHTFKANLSAGHVAEMVIEADELTGLIMPQAQNTATKNTEQQTKSSGEAAAAGALMLNNQISVGQLQSIVRSAVAQQVKPLQKELRAYKEKVMLRDIVGGLGFIFGLFGVAAWMASKRKVGEKHATVS